jgi:hypothetical protein
MLVTAIEYWILWVLPLWVLAANLNPVIPVAAAATLLPVIVCAIAGVQAVLPPERLRWWSRPLVAWLFLLQPLVRGWARYRGRLLRRRSNGAVRENLDSATLRDGTDRLDAVQFWCQQRISRLDFVKTILRRLDAAGWPNRPDAGWSEFDVELQGSRWCVVQLTSVTEEHRRKTQMLRCRLRARWSLTATLLFWSLLGLELVLVGPLIGPSIAAGLAVLMATAMWWFLWRQERQLQSQTIVLLDQLAKEQGLVKVQWDEKLGRVKPV